MPSIERPSFNIFSNTGPDPPRRFSHLIIGLGRQDCPGTRTTPDRARGLPGKPDRWTSHRPTLLLYKNFYGPFRLRLATIIQDHLKNVGIEVIIQSHDWGTFYGDIKAGRFQMYSLAWVGVKTPDIFRYAFHSQSIPGRRQPGHFASQVADQLIR
ncbi:MAG: ABC transporter substrate-binding protein [Nitrospirales bacterium]|nr:ABC transporter substrate-binding protein [Nitrospirales bacterium]